MTASLFEQHRAVDTDTHLTEPPDTWTSRLSSRWGDAVPHLERALELAPRSLDNLELLVVAYLESGLREQASQAVGDALASGHLPPEMAARYQLLIEQHE